MRLGKTIVATSLTLLMGLLSISCSSLKSLGASSSDETAAPKSEAYRKVIEQNAENYTIQIAAGSDADHLKQSYTSNPINCEIFHFQIKVGKKDKSSVMTCGSFTSLEEANSVMLSLPVVLNSTSSGIYQWKALQIRAANE